MPTIDLKKQERNITLELNRPDEIDTEKRFFVAELVKTALDKFLDFEDLKADNKYSLYKLPIINEETDIIDFEINNLSVYVIPTIDKSKNINVYIPKSYSKYSVKPDVIIFVNFSKTLTKMDITGFITNFDGNKLTISKNELKSGDDLVDTLKHLRPQNRKGAENAINATKELMLAYIDDSLSEEGREFFVKHLILTNEIRKNYKLFSTLNDNFITIADKYLDKVQSSYAINEPIKLDEPMQDVETNNIIEQESEENIIQDNLEQNTADDILNINDEQEILQNFETEEIESENIISETPMMENDIVQLDSEPLQEETINFVEADSQSDFELEPLEDLPEFENGLSDMQNASSDEFNVEEPILEQDTETPILPEQDDTLVQQQEISDNDRNAVMTDLFDAPKSDENIESANQDEDIFSFLDDISAGDNLGENANIQEQMQETLPEEQGAADFIQEAEQPMQEDSVADTSVEAIAGENNLDLAFDNSNQVEQQLQEENLNVQENNYQNVEAVAPQKNSTLLVAAMVGFLGVAILGGGFYLLKDKFLGGSAISGLAEDSQQLDLPAPIDANTVLPEGTQASLDGETPPPPTANKEGDAPAKAPGQDNAKANNPAAEENLPSLPGAPGATTIEPPKPKHMNDAIATALSKDFSGVRISKVSWEISETLAANPEVKRYLTIAGKSIKTSLSQDLTAATEPSFKDYITVNITYNKNGSVVKTTIAKSSGSTQIDNIVLKSVKDTLTYVKMPALNLNKPEYNAELIIRL